MYWPKNGRLDETWQQFKKKLPYWLGKQDSIWVFLFKDFLLDNNKTLSQCLFTDWRNALINFKRIQNRSDMLQVFDRLDAEGEDYVWQDYVCFCYHRVVWCFLDPKMRSSTSRLNILLKSDSANLRTNQESRRMRIPSKLTAENSEKNFYWFVILGKEEKLQSYPSPWSRKSRKCKQW